MAAPLLPSASGACGGFQDLPVELLELVLTYLHRSDAKALRMTSKSVEQKISPYFFRSVVVPFNSELQDMVKLDIQTRNGESGKGKGKRPAMDDDHVFLEESYLPWMQQRSANHDTYRGHGYKVFSGFGRHIRNFGMSFEVTEDDLRRPPVKQLLDTHESFYGSYQWPPPSYRRFDKLASLERTADEMSPLRDAMKHLQNVKDLGLSLNNGLGRLSGSERPSGTSKPTRIFGNIFTLPLPVSEPTRSSLPDISNLAPGEDADSKVSLLAEALTAVRDRLREVAGTVPPFSRELIRRAIQLERNQPEALTIIGELEPEQLETLTDLAYFTEGVFPPSRAAAQAAQAANTTAINTTTLDDNNTGRQVTTGIHDAPALARAMRDTQDLLNSELPDSRAPLGTRSLESSRVRGAGEDNHPRIGDLESVMRQPLTRTNSWQETSQARRGRGLDREDPDTIDSLQRAPAPTTSERDSSPGLSQSTAPERPRVQVQDDMFSRIQYQQHAESVLASIEGEAEAAEKLLNPSQLTQTQKEWLLEADWAMRAFLQSYMLSIVDNKHIFQNITTFNIAYLSSRFLPVMSRTDFWSSFPVLEKLTLHVSPDWRSVERADYDITDKAVKPSDTCGPFFWLLHNFIGKITSLKELDIGWTQNSNSNPFHASTLPAPVMPLEEAYTDQQQLLVDLPHVERLSLSNCFFAPAAFKNFIRHMQNASLRHLSLKNVSLAADRNPRLLMIQERPIRATGRSALRGVKIRATSWVALLNEIGPRKVLSQLESLDNVEVPRLVNLIDLVNCGYAVSAASSEADLDHPGRPLFRALLPAIRTEGGLNSMRTDDQHVGYPVHDLHSEENDRLVVDFGLVVNGYNTSANDVWGLPTDVDSWAIGGSHCFSGTLTRD